jgi:hypothetical protein
MMVLTRQERWLLELLGGDPAGHAVNGLRGTALDTLVGSRLAVLVAPDRIALTETGRALLKKLGPWEAGT